MKRPELNDRISPEDFKNFYWLKAELTAFCKTKGISPAGGKIEIADRIATFLSTGQVPGHAPKPLRKVASRFDWGNAVLSVETTLTDNYKSTENVRRFLTQQIGSHFRFTIAFMDWIKQHPGKTLADAITEWKRQHEKRKDRNIQTEIAPQFEYNRYIRAFMADNPDKNIKDAINSWKKTRAMPGSNEYVRTAAE